MELFVGVILYEIFNQILGKEIITVNVLTSELILQSKKTATLLIMKKDIPGTNLETLCFCSCLIITCSNEHN